MSDSYVQIDPDGSGKKIDTVEATRSDDVDIERQRLAIGDESDPAATVRVSGESGRGEARMTDIAVLSKLGEIHDTLNQIASLLAAILHS